MNTQAETDPIIRLAALNGPGQPLAILMAMLLSRRTQISESEIAALLSMNAKTVRRGLQRLAQMQVITRTQRYGGWMLTEGGRQLVLTSPMLLTTGERTVNFTAPEGSQITAPTASPENRAVNADPSSGKLPLEGSQITAPALTTVVVVNRDSESLNPQTQLTTTTVFNSGSGKSSGKNYRSADVKDDPRYQPALRAALDIGEAVEILWGAPLWPNVAQKIAENTVRRAWAPENKHLPVLEDLLGWIAYVVENASGIRTSAPGAVAANILGCRKPATCYRKRPGDYLPAAFLEAAGQAHLIPVREDLPAPLFDIEPEEDEPEEDEAPPAALPPPVTQKPHLYERQASGGMSADQAWRTAVGQLQLEIPKSAFDTWVGHAELEDFDPDTGAFLIRVPNDYARDWLQSRLTSTVVRLLTGMCNRSVEVKFVALDQSEQ